MVSPQPRPCLSNGADLAWQQGRILSPLQLQRWCNRCSHTVRSLEANTKIQRASIASPINLILVSSLVLLIYYRLRPSTAPALPKAPPPLVFKTFTPPALKPYNGEKNMPVYLAVRGKVFDVTPGRNFYGPGGPYENFAGRDASRGLACGSFDEDMLTKDLDGPLDELKDLEGDQLEALRDWEERFNEKYLVVGKLVATGSPDAPTDS